MELCFHGDTPHIAYPTKGCSQVGVTNKTTYMDTGLTPSTAYYYKVYAESGSFQTNTAGPVRQVTRAPKQ